MAGSARPGPPVIGLDIGGTKVLGVLLGADDVVVGSVRLPTVRGVDGVVATASAAVRALLAGAGIAPGAAGEAVAVGVGVPGVVDPAAGTVAHAVNLGLPGEATPLARLLSGSLGGAPVRVENDLNAAVLGVARALAATDLAFLALGTGIAAGLLLDGRLRRGAFGAAGEIGHLPYRLDGLVCPCGQHGCLELYASGASLDARWPAAVGTPPPAALFAAAAAGDPAATVLRDEFARAVAAAVRILVLTTDVEHVVLGGGVSEVGEPLLAAVVHALTVQAGESAFLGSLNIAARVRLPPAGSPVAAIGAALVARGTVAPWK
ncbi:ROK family protein [Pengzhenrongella sicca]|uniref:ROK family protein n=1 Tax=Pengzhenrongella sicca TaxID=2819238 RepID=A0A8A4ZEJ3_9MICO|nr:ROK family protein [Pengzhenrongella sicca]QTE30400.1 ROK family protein [Pengzhenrongella sicca]